ncbi:protein PXR1-like [Sesamum indicum]|uniref:Protein PXR1-like n=1 Tax=Sesamum indicum TaxID=4182 RepID=A0A8M8UZP0_SESIN|nr:protein PXR1-like [Sesamum indicum]
MIYPYISLIRLVSQLWGNKASNISLATYHQERAGKVDLTMNIVEHKSGGIYAGGGISSGLQERISKDAMGDKLKRIGTPKRKSEEKEQKEKEKQKKNKKKKKRKRDQYSAKKKKRDRKAIPTEF